MPSNWSEKSFSTFGPGDPQINRVPLLLKMDVWTKFKEGRSKRYRVIDRKRKGYRRTDLPTDRHVQSNIPSLLWSGWAHNYNVTHYYVSLYMLVGLLAMLTKALIIQSFLLTTIRKCLLNPKEGIFSSLAEIRETSLYRHRMVVRREGLNTWILWFVAKVSTRDFSGTFVSDYRHITYWHNLARNVETLPSALDWTRDVN